MRKEALLVLLLVGTVFASLDVEEASQVAVQYKEAAEGIDIQPQELTYVGVSSYWMMEITSLSRIVVIIPIDSETGAVETAEFIKPGIKTHYLANFLYTHDEIDDFLGSTLSMTQNMQADFETKLDQFESIWEPQIPSNVTLSSKTSYKSALNAAITKAESLRKEITTLRSNLATISTPDQIGLVQSGFSGFFTSESAFIASLRSVSTASSSLTKEVNEETQAGNIGQSLASGIINSITFSGLTSNVIQMEDNLQANQDAINGFFSDIDEKGDSFYSKLVSRVTGVVDPELKAAVLANITSFTTDYNDIAGKRGTIPPQYDTQIKELQGLLNDTQEYYVNDNLTAAQALFPGIEGKISVLKAQIGKWPPICSGGKYWSGAACVCPSGTVEEGGACVTSGGGGINWSIVILLLVVIIGLIVFRYKDKLFKKGGEVTDETGGYLEGYSRF